MRGRRGWKRKVGCNQVGTHQNHFLVATPNGWTARLIWTPAWMRGALRTLMLDGSMAVTVGRRMTNARMRPPETSKGTRKRQQRLLPRVVRGRIGALTSCSFQAGSRPARPRCPPSSAVWTSTRRSKP